MAYKLMRNQELVVTDDFVKNFRKMLTSILDGSYQNDNFCAGCFEQIDTPKFCNYCYQAYCYKACKECLSCREMLEINDSEYWEMMDKIYPSDFI